MKTVILFLLVIMVFVPVRTDQVNTEQEEEEELHSTRRRSSGSNIEEVKETLSNVEYNNANQVHSFKKKYERDTRKLPEDLDKSDGANVGYRKQISDLQQRVKEMATKVTTKKNEIDNIRRSSAHAIEELQHTLIDVETRYKTEITRIKKKYETDIRELEGALDNANKANVEYLKQTRAMQRRVKEMETKVTTKDDEIDNIRKISTSRITELQRTLVDIESNYEAQIYRFKKKYDRDIRELEGSLDTANRASAQYPKQIRVLQQKVKEIEAKVAKKDEEIDNIRKSSLKTKMELQTALVDLEIHYETKIRRIKEKHLADATAVDDALGKSYRRLEQRVQG